MDIALYVSLGFSAIILSIVFGNLYWDKIKKFFTKSWFKVVFSFCAAVLGFVIMDNAIAGKIAGAVLFFALGFGIASLLKSLLSSIKIKPLVIIIEIILCALLLVFAVTREYGTPNTYEDNSKLCSWCETRYAKPGSSYCNSCYDKLFRN